MKEQPQASSPEALHCSKQHIQQQKQQQQNGHHLYAYNGWELAEGDSSLEAEYQATLADHPPGLDQVNWQLQQRGILPSISHLHTGSSRADEGETHGIHETHLVSSSQPRSFNNSFIDPQPTDLTQLYGAVTDSIEPDWTLFEAFGSQDQAPTTHATNTVMCSQGKSGHSFRSTSQGHAGSAQGLTADMNNPAAWSQQHYHEEAEGTVPTAAPGAMHADDNMHLINSGVPTGSAVGLHAKSWISRSPGASSPQQILRQGSSLQRNLRLQQLQRLLATGQLPADVATTVMSVLDRAQASGIVLPPPTSPRVAVGDDPSFSAAALCSRQGLVPPNHSPSASKAVESHKPHITTADQGPPSLHNYGYLLPPGSSSPRTGMVRSYGGPVLERSPTHHFPTSQQTQQYSHVHYEGNTLGQQSQLYDVGNEASTIQGHVVYYGNPMVPASSPRMPASSLMAAATSPRMPTCSPMMPASSPGSCTQHDDPRVGVPCPGTMAPHTWGHHQQQQDMPSLASRTQQHQPQHQHHAVPPQAYAWTRRPTTSAHPHHVSYTAGFSGTINHLHNNLPSTRSPYTSAKKRGGRASVGGARRGMPTFQRRSKGFLSNALANQRSDIHAEQHHAGGGSSQQLNEGHVSTEGDQGIPEVAHQSKASRTETSSAHGHAQEMQQQQQQQQQETGGIPSEIDSVGDNKGNASDRHHVPTIAAMLAAGCNLDLSQAMAAGENFPSEHSGDLLSGLTGEISDSYVHKGGTGAGEATSLNKPVAQSAPDRGHPQGGRDQLGLPRRGGCRTRGRFVASLPLRKGDSVGGTNDVEEAVRQSAVDIPEQAFAPKVSPGRGGGRRRGRRGRATGLRGRGRVARRGGRAEAIPRIEERGEEQQLKKSDSSETRDDLELQEESWSELSLPSKASKKSTKPTVRASAKPKITIRLPPSAQTAQMLQQKSQGEACNVEDGQCEIRTGGQSEGQRHQLDDRDCLDLKLIAARVRDIAKVCGLFPPAVTKNASQTATLVSNEIFEEELNELTQAEQWIQQVLQQQQQTQPKQRRGAEAPPSAAQNQASDPMTVISAAPVSQTQVFQVALLATGRAAATVDQLHSVLVEWLKEGVADILSEKQNNAQLVATLLPKNKTNFPRKHGQSTSEDQSGIRTWKGWAHVCGFLGLPTDDSSLEKAAVRALEHASGQQGLNSVRNCLEICRREEGGLQPVQDMVGGKGVEPTAKAGPSSSAPVQSRSSAVLWTFDATRRVDKAPVNGSAVVSAFEPSTAAMQDSNAELEQRRETLKVRKRWMSQICAAEERRVQQALSMRRRDTTLLKESKHYG
ncbi:hypothetical protein CEUSTIGMA_g590.t1 [Chlamydomonas eustigma]|uniref:Uncharacterized protein n=1 Tax=Chlamydomonas eustigma TaxID=1157962 RepID=A0A250WQL7_9CHLO|nr:hypothetical protein CEUSTIGMA_g590.t1 [Chlamydomonas eustigma]|eukprot:GAX73137.1 hypothetical protein CEUSTIGMA_g590.t1 [Chlamydomonas eustigma]